MDGIQLQVQRGRMLSTHTDLSRHMLGTRAMSRTRVKPMIVRYGIGLEVAPEYDEAPLFSTITAEFRPYDPALSYNVFEQQFVKETLPDYEIYPFNVREDRPVRHTEPLGLDEFIPSNSLSHAYLAAVARAGSSQTASVLPIIESEREASDVLLSDSDVIEELRSFITGRTYGLFATVAYRDAASGSEGRYITERGFRFTSETAQLFVDTFVLDAYEAPVFLRHLAQEIATAAAVGSLRGNWGEVELRSGRLYLRNNQSATDSSPSSGVERARVVGGIKL
jgi:hypothetical protein